VSRSLKVTAETMVRAGLRPAGVDGLLLVGGTTYIPMVRDAVTRMMSNPGEHPGDPQTAVACGAAIVAARQRSRAA
jgi:molecular chaperone DnaK (HSP70)